MAVSFVAWLLALGAGAAFASTVTIIQSEPPVTMDPANHTATYTSAVLYPIYETLTDFDQAMNVVPGLAEKWEPSKDATQWVFHLRQGVLFHDGTRFDAAAVKTSFDRVLDPANGLATLGRFGAVIDRVEVVDTYTVRFILKKPYAAFDRLVAIGGASIISPKAIKELGDGLARKAVGTGPYRFVEWATGERVVMDKWTKYWRGEPKVDRLVWKWSPEPSVMAMALQAGEADIAFPLPPAYVATLQRQRDIRILESTSGRVFWASLTTLRTPLKDARVRQALNYATDREGLIKAILQGHGTVANSVMAPLTFGYDPKSVAYPYDVKKAKALLAEAGYPNGFSMSITVQEAERPLAEALQANWAEIGVDVTVDLQEYGLWVDNVFAPPDQNKTYSVIASWSSGTMDADLALTPLFHTRSWAPAGANLGFYSNPRVDDLLDRAAATVSSQDRLSLYAEVQRILREEAPHVSLYYVNNLAGVRDRVEGVWVQPLGLVVARDLKVVK